MKTKVNRHSHDETAGLPSLKLQARLVKQERACSKNELLAALQEAKEKRKHAHALEKRACANENKARKLAKKAEHATHDAMLAKQFAEQAWFDAVEAQKSADSKRVQMKAITERMKLAEQKARQSRKSAHIKHKLVNSSV